MVSAISTLRASLVILFSPSYFSIFIPISLAPLLPCYFTFESQDPPPPPLPRVAYIMYCGQTVGTPTVAVSTLLMAGSLVQVPTMEVAATLERGSNGTRRNWRRHRISMGVLHVVCRLVAVRIFLPYFPSSEAILFVFFVLSREAFWFVYIRAYDLIFF